MFVYAVTNHKGGVGKTTAVATLGAAFARAGRRVLLIDLDPQSSLTASVGVRPDGSSVETILESPWAIEEAIVSCGSGMEIVPARATLAIKLHEILTAVASATRLSLALENVACVYNTVLIDCPSTMGAALTNALTAADVALIPMQCDFLSLRGMADMQSICGTIIRTTNTRLQTLAFANMFDRRTRHGADVLQEAQEALGCKMLETLIPRSIRLAEAPATGTTVLDYAPRSRGAEAYCRLATELMETEKRYGTTGRHPGGDTRPIINPGGSGTGRAGLESTGT